MLLFSQVAGLESIPTILLKADSDMGCLCIFFICFLAKLQFSMNTVGSYFTENNMFKMYSVYKDVLYKKE